MSDSGSESICKVGVNQGLELDLLPESLVITGACLSSKEDRVVL